MDQLREVLVHIRTLRKEVKDNYTTWIKRNPGRASDVESLIKLASCLLHGRFKINSTILPELLYCSSNLLSFWHDSLLKAEADRLTAAKSINSTPCKQLNGLSSETACAHSIHMKFREVHRVKSLLTILEYFEFFLEVSAKQMWGDVGRWIVILIVQLIKSCIRLVLLFRFKVGMIESPALQPYDRKANQIINSSAAPPISVGFVLKHSGRVVRKIHAAPPLASRKWNAPAITNVIVEPYDLPPLRLIGEIIHILRPLSHLVCLGRWGTLSWKPWLVSLALDISSLHLHGSQGHRRREKLELTRRTYALLYYLIRSPFYDSFTRQRLLRTLMFIGNRVPIIGILCNSIAQAIPEWQDTYSYVWNDV